MDSQLNAPIWQESSGASGRLTSVTADSALVGFTNGAPFDASGEVLVNGASLGVPRAVSKQAPTESLPSARYIELMVEGARSVDMDPVEIEKIASTPCSPRKAASERARIPVREEARQT